MRAVLSCCCAVSRSLRAETVINHNTDAPRTSRDHKLHRDTHTHTHSITAALCVTFDIITLICYINCLQAVALRNHLLKQMNENIHEVKKAIGTIYCFAEGKGLILFFPDLLK